jgi:hypothetical protein
MHNPTQSSAAAPRFVDLVADLPPALAAFPLRAMCVHATVIVRRLLSLITQLSR